MTPSLTHLSDTRDNDDQSMDPEVDNTGSQPTELLTVTQFPDASQSQSVVGGRKFKLTQSNFRSQNSRPTFNCFKDGVLYN